MTQFIVALEAALRVLFFAGLVGAGLPALYGFGVRHLAAAVTLPEQPARARVHRGVAYSSFILAILMVALGLTYIIAHGFGVEVTFNGIIPVITR